MWRLWSLAICFTLIAIGATQTSLKPSYLPAIGRTFSYRLLVNGEVQAEASGFAWFAQFGATIEIEQKWQKMGDKLKCDLTIKGGKLRVFSSVGERIQKLGWVQLTFITTPTGEILDIMGGGARSIDELVANFDLMATALAALVLPFPKEGVQIGDAWQGVHQLGATVTLATVQCVEQPANLPPRLQPIKLRLRYLLPIDALVDPTLRSQWNFTARYSAESEVMFSITEGRTISASGTIKLEVGTKIPVPKLSQDVNPNQEQSQPEGEQREEGQQSQQQGQQSQGQNQQPPSTPTPTPSFQLKVEAKFDIVPML
ncbi:MAG: hypothetical protein NZ805_00165 [Armatimonadetes bacterium]|nr:hypothetical protein [Armatimonadota bacterium]MDW8026931.1 hypothetical protein [Armatimonadota bacterium]